MMGACAHPLTQVGPEDIPELEARAEASPDDLEVRTQLGVAYYEDGRYLEARDILGRVVEDGSTEGAAFLYLGLANEELEDWAGAREAYSGYLEVGRYDRLRGELQSRLQLIIRNEIEAEVRAALDQEAELMDTPPEPRTVAVFPFRLVADREDLEPLQVAMADMVITDLASVGAVMVLERSRIQSLVNEMALTEAGYTEPETGARAGRLLRAEHVVQGALTPVTDELLRFDADVVRTEGETSVGTPSGEDDLEALFDLEKEIVFGILDALGVEPTDAERQAILDNRTESLEAFLAYGRGLQAMDRGSFQEASQFFREAATLDPTFQRAEEHAQESEELQSAQQASTADVAAAGEAEFSGVSGVDTEALEATQDLLEMTGDELSPSPASGTLGGGSGGGTGEGAGEKETQRQERGGGDNVTEGRTTTIRIQIPRPGGGGL